jgi:hypothetical protein
MCIHSVLVSGALKRIVYLEIFNISDNMGPEGKPLSPFDSDMEFAQQEMTARHEKIDELGRKESEMTLNEAQYENMLQEKIMMERRPREMQAKAQARTEASFSHGPKNVDFILRRRTCL